MTIAELLHHHGVHVPRFVSVNGRIVFDGVSQTPVGFTHKSLGAVTPVANHTFHGGTAEAHDEPKTPAYWWEDADVVTRHVTAMGAAFPEFTYLPAASNTGPYWGGEIDTGRGKFNLMVFTRRDAGLPRIMVHGVRLGVNAGKRWIPSPHLYTNGNLCVADEADWQPGRHTAATATCWAAHWLAAYTEWRFTRRWPVDGVQSVAA